MKVENGSSKYSDALCFAKPFHAESCPTAAQLSVTENKLNPLTSERPHVDALTYRQWRFWLMNGTPLQKNI